RHVRRPAVAAERADRLPGGAGARLVRRGAAAAAAAGPAQRRLHGGDGGHLPAAAGGHRGAAGDRAADPGVAADVAEGGRGGARPVGGRTVSVVIVGGGLAGISAAIALREAGVPVTLVESRPWLGGAAHSFARGELCVDNGQHVFLRCCTAYRGLLRRLRSDHLVEVQDRFDVPVLLPGGRKGLRRSRLPSPLHVLRALAGYSPLPVADRLRAVRASRGLRRLDPADPANDAVSAGAWLAEHGQRPWARQALWGLFLTSALNAEVDDAALGLSAMVCRHALLGRADAADIGVPLVPPEELHGGPALRRIAEMGGTVRLKSKVEAVTTDPKVVVDGVPMAADAVIMAVPHEAAARLLPAQALPDPLPWPELDASPIVNVHVVYDREVMREPFAAAVGSSVQWVFDRTAVSGLRRGQYLAVSLSAADRWV